MNMDFNRPTQKIRDMAEQANIDLKDERVMDELKYVQTQVLDEIKRLKEGKTPLTQEELQKARRKVLDQREQERIAEIENE